MIGFGFEIHLPGVSISLGPMRVKALLACFLTTHTHYSPPKYRRCFRLSSPVPSAVLTRRIRAMMTLIDSTDMWFITSTEW